MSRRSHNSSAWVVIVVAGLIVGGMAKVVETIGWGWTIGIPAILCCVVIAHRHLAAKVQAVEQEKRLRMRRSELSGKYGDDSIVERILRRTCWQGQTSEQLRDSLGPPTDVDEKVLKTKRKEVWKYYPRGGNRYGLRVTLENDTVVGWDEKL